MRSVILEVVEMRFGALPAEQREAITARAEGPEGERILERLCTATSLADLLAED
jgi:hypothetical protein